MSLVATSDAATGGFGLPSVIALVIAALGVCWLVLRLVLRETVRFSAHLGEPQSAPPRTASAAEPAPDSADDTTRRGG